MSRIGRLPVAIPSGVDIKIDGQTVNVKGPKGQLTRTFHQNMKIEREDGKIAVQRADDSQQNRALHGLTRTLIANMGACVTTGFAKELEFLVFFFCDDGDHVRDQSPGETVERAVL